eukprot:2264766-Prorocentrum_lima.AAC.1
MAIDAVSDTDATLPLAKRRDTGRSEKHANLRQPTDWHIQPGGSRKCTCRLCCTFILKNELRVFRASDRVTGGRAIHLECLPGGF